VQSGFNLAMRPSAIPVAPLAREPLRTATALRRRELGLGLAAACLALPALASSRQRLPAMGDGPFYPPKAWRERWPDWDADLTRVQRPGSPASAQGEALALMLTVADERGRVIDGAVVEIWQCDALGHYHHPRVQQVAGGFDPGFAGFGSASSGAEGTVRFRTIRPVAYPGRTPHIHVKLRHPSFGEHTSQLFVVGEAGNARDFLWRQLSAQEQGAAAMRLDAAPVESGLRWQARHTLVVPA
jgi:protocatechuate 3,4-dioxygenase beta subunit